MTSDQCVEVLEVELPSDELLDSAGFATQSTCRGTDGNWTQPLRQTSVEAGGVLGGASS